VIIAVAFLGLKIATSRAITIAIIIVIGLALAWFASTRWPLTRTLGSGIARARAARDRVGRDRLRIVGKAALASWFAGLTYGRIRQYLRSEVPLGQDIRIYYRAVQLWLHGGNPWSAAIVVGTHARVFSYAGSPATTILLAPSALLSEDQFTALWLALTAMSAVAIVRWLRLPLWWILFPPTVEALYSGNPQIVVLMLLLAGAARSGGLADALAVGLKVYALVPLLGERRPRRIILALSVTVATVLVAPSLWVDYLEQLGSISARLATESANGYSAFYYPLLLIPTAIAIALLWRIDRRAAAWLAVPALWPASEFHYSTLALPVMTPLLAVLLAIPIQRLAPFVIMLYVGWRYASGPVRDRLDAWVTVASDSPG